MLPASAKIRSSLPIGNAESLYLPVSWMAIARMSADPCGRMATQTIKRNRQSARRLPEGARRRTADGSIVSHVVSLDALGWRVVELRPSFIDGEVSLWHVTAKRVDFDASMHMTAGDLDVALAELVRYASVDASGGR